MGLNLSELERGVLARWEENDTFRRSVENRIGCERFVMWEGPPTANGKPGIHHVLTRTFKDIIARHQTMKRRFVERKAGWDEHGLPVEIEVAKQLGLTTKADIEAFGVKEFNARCAESTQRYIGDWVELTRRMGYWLDFENAYRTSDDKYIKGVWHVLNCMMGYGLIYQAHKIVPWACDSGTAVSNAEVALGYKNITVNSAYVLFPLSGEFRGETTPTYLCAWTTTPWTLPANMSLAVGADLEYKICRVGEKKIISLMEHGEVVGTVKGKELTAHTYWALFGPVVDRQIYAADFVRNEKTGIVHIAPAFGQDDYELHVKEEPCKKIICHVNPDGSFNDEAPIFLQGKKVFYKNFDKADNLVLGVLQERGLLQQIEPFTHEYPHNWRTGLPLIYYLRPSWFVSVKKLREEMVGANETVNWFPAHIKDGRFGKWIAGEVDWAISRERFWGTPLPFYGDTYFFPPGTHKPEADEPIDGLQRTPEVLDCWFDSGAMPFAAELGGYRPADVICEAVDQTRGWFYSLMVIGVAMTGKSPYKNVLCLGHVLDKDGHKMSKSKGNTVDPMALFEKYGADAVRWTMAKNPVGNSLIFKEEDIRNVSVGFLNRLWNCWTFYDMYAKAKNCRVDGSAVDMSEGTLNRWIMAEADQMYRACGALYDNYNFSAATEHVEKFVDKLSNIWLRAKRNDFNCDVESVYRSSFAVLAYCLESVCIAAAPIIPFITDEIYHNFNRESVHLMDFESIPAVCAQYRELMAQMDAAQEAIALGHAVRKEKGVKVRQPLSTFYVPARINPEWVVFDWLIMEELNVKKVLRSGYEIPEPRYDLEITDELLGEGYARELTRTVQQMRKDMGLEVGDQIKLTLDGGDGAVEALIGPHVDDICKKVNAKNFSADASEVSTGTSGPATDKLVKLDIHTVAVRVEKL